MKTQKFTLVELLVVVAIIGILSGLILGGIAAGQKKARETQARADMTAIITALKQVDTTYQKMITKGGSGVPYAPNETSGGYVELGKKGSSASESAYDTFIVELTNPKNNGNFSSANNLNFNKRRLNFLDAKSGYDPAQTGDSAVNQPFLWRDPWGNRYTIRINTDYSDEIPIPYDSSKKILGKVAIYSCGPNGVDDEGRNKADGTGANNQDDIVSWTVN